MTRTYPLLLLLALSALCAACSRSSPPASTDDSAVKAALTKALPEGVSVQILKHSPIPGWKAAAVDGRIVYVSATGKYMMQGALVELSTKTNLTELAETALHKRMLDQVDRDRMIEYAAANPKYRITVFTDVDCGFCRELHSQMAQYNAAGITVDYLLYPRSGISSGSYETEVHVWCAKDRRQALTDAKLGQAVAPVTCDNPVASNYTLGQHLGIVGTPAVYAPNGMLIGGYLSPAQMRAKLDELQGQATTGAL